MIYYLYTYIHKLYQLHFIMSYSMTQINTALVNATVQDTISKKEAKSLEISKYARIIDRLNTDITNTTDRRDAIAAKKAIAESELAVLEAQLQTDIANAL